MKDFLGFSGGAGGAGWDWDANAYRALSEQEMAARAQAMIPLMMQAKPSVEQLLALANYRPQVYVPSGWQDWYASGDQLH